MRIKTVIIAYLLLLISDYAAAAPLTAKVTGLGVSGEYTLIDNEHDGGLWLSFKKGEMGILNYFFDVDAGYRFVTQDLCAKTGVEFMIAFLGIEVGALMVYELMDSEKLYGGAYVGLAAIMRDEFALVFISLGGNFFFAKRKKEFYIRVTYLINISAD